MRLSPTALPLALLLAAALTGCSGDEPADPAAAASSAAPAAGPALFGPDRADRRLLTAADLPGSAAVPVRPGQPPRAGLQLCSAKTPAPAATVSSVTLLDRSGKLFVQEDLVVLADDAAATALQDAVAAHAKGCASTTATIPPAQGGGTFSTRLIAPVTLTEGAWSGLRQKSALSTTSGSKSSDALVESVVLRRANAVVALRLLREGEAPDLTPVLAAALKRLDAQTGTTRAPSPAG